MAAKTRARTDRTLILPAREIAVVNLRMPGMALVIAVSWLANTPAFADDRSDFSEAAERLRRMSTAMSQMTYQGTFVYVQGALVETMRITHVVDEEGVHERLVAQSGPQREVQRDSSGVRWIARDSRSVVQDPAFSRSYFPEVSMGALEGAAEHYEFRIGGQEPIAGRLGRKLGIVPRDAYRYGYTLWLEEPSGLLLKWELYEDRARPLARLVFTEIRIGAEVDRGELRSFESTEEYLLQASDLPEKQELTRAVPRWAPSHLPPGFRLTSHRRQYKSSAGVFQHLVYSDGIAAVSVYVEKQLQEAAPYDGISRLGTTHAFSRQSEDLQITVVGDVPALTVKEIGEAVTLTAP